MTQRTSHVGHHTRCNEAPDAGHSGDPRTFNGRHYLRQAEFKRRRNPRAGGTNYWVQGRLWATSTGWQKECTIISTLERPADATVSTRRLLLTERAELGKIPEDMKRRVVTEESNGPLVNARYSRPEENKKRGPPFLRGLQEAEWRH
jgi:hypothetical protein